MTAKKKYFYLATLAFHGYRYFGWQKQRHLPTIQGELEKALQHIFPRESPYTMAAGRTDAQVSAFAQKVKIHLNEKIESCELKSRLNQLLSTDIRVVKVEASQSSARLINLAQDKTYLYFFSYAQTNNPFQTSHIPHFKEYLNIEKMKKAARVFEGEHNFYHFQHKCSEKSHFKRTVKQCQIFEDHQYFKGAMFTRAHYLSITAEGFLKQMVRLIMGALINVGRDKISLEELQKSLKGEGQAVGFIAPAYGLYLHSVRLKGEHCERGNAPHPPQYN